MLTVAHEAGGGDDRKNVHQFVLNYPGNSGCDCKCGLIIKKEENNLTVIMTELNNNPHSTITHVILELINRIYCDFLENEAPLNVKWIQHFTARGNIPESFSQVHVTWTGIQYRHPRFEELKTSLILSLIKNAKDYFSHPLNLYISWHPARTVIIKPFREIINGNSNNK